MDRKLSIRYLQNLYGIDLEKTAMEKEVINNEKYHNSITLEEGR